MSEVTAGFYCTSSANGKARNFYVPAVTLPHMEVRRKRERDALSLCIRRDEKPKLPDDRGGGKAFCPARESSQIAHYPKTPKPRESNKSDGVVKI